MKMEVININDKSEQRRKANMLEVIEEVRKRIEDGNMEEFVMSSIDKDGEVNIHASVKDLIGGVGLFEIGKNILISQQTMVDYE
jgi:hypothetical protein